LGHFWANHLSALLDIAGSGCQTRLVVQKLVLKSGQWLSETGGIQKCHPKTSAQSGSGL